MLVWLLSGFLPLCFWLGVTCWTDTERTSWGSAGVGSAWHGNELGSWRGGPNMTFHDPKRHKTDECWSSVSVFYVFPPKFHPISEFGRKGRKGRHHLVTLCIGLAQRYKEIYILSFEAARSKRCVVRSAAVVVAVPAWVVVAWVWCSASWWWVVSSWQLRILYWSGSQHTRRRFKKWGHASMPQRLKPIRLWLTNCQLSVGICFVTNAMVTSSYAFSEVFYSEEKT